MISPLAAALGAQLAVIAASKIRQGQATSDQPLLLALGHHTPTWAVAALDAAAATLVAWPLTTGPAATLVAAGIAGSEVGVLALRGRGVTSCGCLGTQSADTKRWREHVAKAIMGLEAVGVTMGHLVPLPGVDVAVTAVVATALLALVIPDVVTSLWRHGPLTLAEARRALKRDSSFGRWRPHLLNQRPSDVRLANRTWRIVFDAWLNDTPVLVVASVSRTRVSVRAHKAATGTVTDLATN